MEQSSKSSANPSTCGCRVDGRKETLPNLPVEQGNLGQPKPFVRLLNSFVWSLTIHGGCLAACRFHLGVDMEGVVGTVLTGLSLHETNTGIVFRKTRKENDLPQTDSLHEIFYHKYSQMAKPLSA